MNRLITLAMCVCVCVCACARVCVCVCEGVRTGKRGGKRRDKGTRKRREGKRKERINFVQTKQSTVASWIELIIIVILYGRLKVRIPARRIFHPNKQLAKLSPPNIPYIITPDSDSNKGHDQAHSLKRH